MFFRNLFIAVITLLVAVSASWAQQPYSNQSQGYGSSPSYVTVYEDCDFRGKSRALAVGEYGNVRDLNLRNDEISSVEVPQGFELVLFEHERLRGKSTLITSDVRCLNRAWDNETSSIRVSQSKNSNYWQNDRPVVQNRPGPARHAESRGRDLSAGVTYVAFASSALEQTRNGQWQIRNQNGSVDRFREISRDWKSITLQNHRIDQRVTIDLDAGRVQFAVPNGNRVDFTITSTQNRQLNRQQTQNRSNQASGVIPSACFNYRAYTRGGQGGVRFHGHDGFFRFSKKAHTGRICHDGPLTMEINKNQKSTDVLIDINGETYRFAPNEQEDVLLNTWYRKKVRLQVGR